MRSPKEFSTIAEAVRHPLRIRILEVVNEQDMAPSEFVEAGYADFFLGHRPDVSHVAYHFRELADFGCLEEVAWRRSRGSVATTYRGRARVEIGDAGWAELTEEEKRDLSRAVARGLFARIDGAFIDDTFTARDDHRLSWSAMRVDERGWEEARQALVEAFATVDRIKADAETRLRETGQKGVTATAGILLFQSPRLPVRPGTDPD